jgi:hypothetical protein
LIDGADGDPAHLASADVEADLEPEDVAVEGERLLRIVVGEEGVVNGDVHGDHVRAAVLLELLDS